MSQPTKAATRESQPQQPKGEKVDPNRPVSREFIEAMKQAGARDSLIEALSTKSAR